MRRYLIPTLCALLLVALMGCKATSKVIDPQAFTDPDQRAVALLLTKRAKAITAGDNVALAGLYTSATLSPGVPQGPSPRKVLYFSDVITAGPMGAVQYTEAEGTTKHENIAFVAKRDEGWKLMLVQDTDTKTGAVGKEAFKTFRKVDETVTDFQQRLNKAMDEGQVMDHVRALAGDLMSLWSDLRSLGKKAGELADEAPAFLAWLEELRDAVMDWILNPPEPAPEQFPQDDGSGTV